MLKNIAIIYKEETAFNHHRFQVLSEAVADIGGKVCTYNHSEQLMCSDFIPDCVLTVNYQEAKLTPYPTYGIMDQPVAHSFSRKRIIRNLLSYDGCVSLSEPNRKTLEDFYFSARKFGGRIGEFTITPSGKYRKVPDFSNASVAYICSNYTKFRGLTSITQELHRSHVLNVYGKKSVVKKHFGKRAMPLEFGEQHTARAYHENGIGLELWGCDDVSENISFRLMEIIASGAIAITSWSSYLYEIFGDNLLYIPMELNEAECILQIKAHIANIHAYPERAEKKAAAAYAIFKEKFSSSVLLSNLQTLHDEIHVSQGYAPPEPNENETLPSVAYVMRTGGNPKYIWRTLDSLAAQSYPHIEVMLLLYKPLPILEEIKKKYAERLKITVIEGYGELRSTAIVSGMRNVTADYFGLMDDDDIIHSNHVQTLINTLKYHNKRDWRGEIKLAYSGAYLASEHMTFPENPEWHDDLLEAGERRRCVEHFCFYDTDTMAINGWHMMSNAWLAHKSLVDDELLQDPETHSHEDLYFELQFALRTHFAFSCEITSVHWFHGMNSTIVDAARNSGDITRHTTRMHLRAFPRARIYRTMDHHLKDKITHLLTIPHAILPAYLCPPPNKRIRQAIYLINKFRYVWKEHGRREAVKRMLWYTHARL